MFQLRGLGDCTATPNDPVCMAFYNTSSPTMVLWQGFHANTPPGASVQQPTPDKSITVTQPASSAWYKSWWGIGLLAIGAFGAYKYSRPKANR